MPKGLNAHNSERGPERPLMTPMSTNTDQVDRQRFSNTRLVESTSSGSGIVFPHMFKKVMQAYPAYPNSALLTGGPVTLNATGPPPAKPNGLKRKISKNLKLGPILMSPNMKKSSGEINLGNDAPAAARTPAPPIAETSREKIELRIPEKEGKTKRKSRTRDENFRPHPLEGGNNEDTLRPRKSGGQINAHAEPEIRLKPPKVKIVETHKSPRVHRAETAGPGLREYFDENSNMESNVDKPEKRAMTASFATNSRIDSSSPYSQHPIVPLKKPQTSNSKLAKKMSPIERPLVVNLKQTKKTVNFETKSCKENVQDNCDKCSVLLKKLKAQTQATRNLQRQNGCLESIITQKRNLVEQLTRQVRGLMKENFQLAKGAGVEPSPENIPTDSTSTTGIPQEDVKNSNMELTSSSSAPSLPTTHDKFQDEEFNRSGSTENIAKISRSRSKTTIPNKRTSRSKIQKQQLQQQRSPDQVEEYDKQIEAMQNANDALQKRFETYKTQAESTNRFLTDLLYTLNARGYESITDEKGTILDLYRCQGDHLLDLKGRDARIRTPAKRMTPQENLLKAVIGSQEKLIQSLFVQLDARTREAMLANKLSLEGGGTSSADAARNASLEAEILALVSLIEGSCQRNPEVLGILHEQVIYDRESKQNSGRICKNVMIDAILDRCARAIAGSPPPSPRRMANSCGNPSRSKTPPSPIRPSSPKPGSNRQSETEEDMIPSAPPEEDCDDSFISKYNQTQAPVQIQNRPPSRTITDNLNRAISPPPSPSIFQAQAMAVQSEAFKRSGIPQRCRFCGMKFPPSMSLAEINCHVELHSA